MERAVLENLLQEIHGCTFATMDAETVPTPGVRKVETGKRVILFTNKRVSGYEQMVKRRLLEAGKTIDSFVLGDLPWGCRIPDTPLIAHKDKIYLQCIELIEGVIEYFHVSDGRKIPEDQYDAWGLNRKRTNQGLPPSEEVQVRAYDLANITKIVLAGQLLVSEKPTRSILRISA